MDQINKIYETIETIENNDEKIKMITELNQKISLQKESYNKLLESINTIPSNFKLLDKYKKLTVDEMEELLNKTDDIEEKINIYYHIISAVNIIKNDLFE